MKPITNLYYEICSFETLYIAYLNARKNKRYREEILRFSSNLEENLLKIQKELQEHTYKTGKYRKFVIVDPKERLIMALPFEDRVVHWAVYLVLNPIFKKQYINDSYGCIIGKGVHSATKRLQYWLRQVHRKEDKYYFLKLDVSKFYYRVDHQVLLNIIRKKIADQEVMALLDEIINSENTAFGLPPGMGIEETEERLFDRGMPIGNLSSQMFANIYMNEIDQYIKRELRVHYYIRYMDDMIILSNSKIELQEIKEKVELFLNERLKLDLNSKTCIRPVTLGIDFVGYKVWNTHIKLRKSTMKRMKRRLQYMKRQYESGQVELAKVTETVASYKGMMQHCNSYNLRKKFFDSYVLRRNSKEDEKNEQSTDH